LAAPGHPLGLALVPFANKVVGILKDLLLGRASGGRFLLGGLPAAVLHFALVEAHGRIVPAAAAMSIRNHGRVDGHWAQY
jgi:hypothetical protein